MGIVGEALKGGEVRGEVVGGLALRTQRVVGEHRDDGREVGGDGGAYLKIAHARSVRTLPLCRRSSSGWDLPARIVRLRR
ncbi:hypothetical protein SGA01_51090 [Streptomyces gardneri]|uniref:Uncharacterized protein n=1 Tax=Streptomyces gardneri TaxID=66892 RepID=A0A4Y3RQA5_9ACTN|nr:hypothetical protein SGA01_51090 [Streptomyces gardneri]